VQRRKRLALKSNYWLPAIRRAFDAQSSDWPARPRGETAARRWLEMIGRDAVFVRPGIGYHRQG
jgi:hypothetical protein